MSGAPHHMATFLVHTQLCLEMRALVSSVLPSMHGEPVDLPSLKGSSFCMLALVTSHHAGSHFMHRELLLHVSLGDP